MATGYGSRTKWWRNLTKTIRQCRMRWCHEKGKRKRTKHVLKMSCRSHWLPANGNAGEPWLIKTIIPNLWCCSHLILNEWGKCSATVRFWHFHVDWRNIMFSPNRQWIKYTAFIIREPPKNLAWAKNHPRKAKPHMEPRLSKEGKRDGQRYIDCLDNWQ